MYVKQLSEDESVDYLLLDYPFAYRNDLIKSYINYAIYIYAVGYSYGSKSFTWYEDASGEEIREDMEYYLKKARTAYQTMLDTIPCNSDYIVNGNQSVDNIVTELLQIIVV